MKRCLACDRTHACDDWRCPACGHQPPLHGRYRSFAQGVAGDGFQPEHFADLAALEEGHFWFVARNRLLVETFRRRFPAMRRFLEIGCGTGYVLSGLARAFPATALGGSEYFAEGLDFAAQRVPQANFYQLDARHLPFVEEFDVIGAFDVLEHIEDDEQVLAQIFRALRPGGGLAVTVPQHRWLWSRQDEVACHVRRYERRELLAKVTRAGFRVEYVTSFVSLLLPAMAAARLFPRRNADAAAELRQSPWLNAGFGRILEVERWLLRHGVCFGMGGSLLVIARRDEA